MAAPLSRERSLTWPMSGHDAMDVLTGFGVLLALMLAVAAWVHTVSEWEATFHALVAPFAAQSMPVTRRPTPMFSQRRIV